MGRLWQWKYLGSLLKRHRKPGNVLKCGQVNLVKRGQCMTNTVWILRTPLYTAPDSCLCSVGYFGATSRDSSTYLVNAKYNNTTQTVPLLDVLVIDRPPPLPFSSTTGKKIKIGQKRAKIKTHPNRPLILTIMDLNEGRT